MISLTEYLSPVSPHIAEKQPWEITRHAASIIASWMADLSSEYLLKEGNAIHRSATVEAGAILKSPCMIGPGSFVASYAYLRGGVWLEKDVIIGPSCEVKSSFIFAGSKAAHFNFIGDSVLGHHVNVEAGAILANYRNECDDKEIICRVDGREVKTGMDKFGALVGDGCRIGANAVLAPGTVLSPKRIVKRLQLVDQSVMSE